MDKQYKTYELEIDEANDALVNAVALTATPAIDSLFLAFNKDENISLKFAVDEDKHELLGAAMIPDFPMLRGANAVINEPHYVKFSAEQIKDAAMAFFKNGFQKNLNIDHTDTNADAFIFQSFIINDEQGINSPKGLDLPNGTWVIGVKCESEEVFKAVKEIGAGFSVEGLFKYKFKSQISVDEKLTQMLLSEIKTILRKIK